MNKKIPIIGYSYGQSSRNTAACEGPDIIKKELNHVINLKWQKTLKINSSKSGLGAMDDIRDLALELAKNVKHSIEKFGNFIVVGGDHSSAIGTWNGAQAKYNNLGLIWIDAHLDSHTSESSHTKNIHGMPLAALLGYGDKKIANLINQKPVLKPENLIVIGASDFETEEHQLLKSLGVKILYLKDLKNNSPFRAIKDAVITLEKNTDGFGVSLDLDVFSKNDAPAVTTYAEGGVDVEATVNALAIATKSHKFVGLEIAEFTPRNDIDNKTLAIIKKIIKNCLLD